MLEAPAFQHSAFEDALRVGVIAAPSVRMLGMPRMLNADIPAFGIRHSAPQPADDATIESFNERVKCWECGACRNAGRADIQHSAFGIPRRPARALPQHISGDYGTEFGQRSDGPGGHGAQRVKMLGMPRMLNADIPAFGIRHSAPQPADDATIESFNERVKCWECGACRNAGRAGIQHSAFGIRHSAFGIRHSAFGIRHSAFPGVPVRGLPQHISGHRVRQRGDGPGVHGAQRVKMLGMRRMPECWRRRHFSIQHSRMRCGWA